MSNMTNRFPNWPMATESEEKELLEALYSNQWWRMTGTKVKEFERIFAEMHNAKYALGVTNGTNAIDLLLKSFKVKEGDEVIVPAFTFISTALPVMSLGAIPVPVDIDPGTFCLDPEKVREAVTERTVGIIPVHMAGHLCDMDRLMEIAGEFNLFVMEDACHAHGGEWKGKRAGSIGDAGVFSFQQFKLMTAGEGGALVTNSQELYDLAFLYHNVGRPFGDKKYQHLVEGTNYRLSEFQAAVLLPQAGRLAEQNQRRERNAKILNEEIQNIEGIVPQGRLEACTLHTYYMYMFYYNPGKFGGISRERFVEMLNEQGIPAYIAYTQIHDTPIFKEFAANLDGSYSFPNQLNCPASRKVAEEVIWIHHRALLGDEETTRGIAQTIREIQSGVKARI